MGGDHEDKPGFPQLVEKRRLCLLLAWGEPAVGNANTHSRSEARAGGRPEELPANRLLVVLARHGSRRLTASASRHWHQGNLRLRLAGPVTRTRRSRSPVRGSEALSDCVRMLLSPRTPFVDSFRIVDDSGLTQIHACCAYEQAPQPRAVRDGLDTWLATSSPEPQTPLVLLYS